MTIAKVHGTLFLRFLRFMRFMRFMRLRSNLFGPPNVGVLVLHAIFNGVFLLAARSGAA